MLERAGCEVGYNHDQKLAMLLTMNVQKTKPFVLFLGILMLGLQAACGFPPGEVNAPMTDRELFDRIDLDHPGLEGVRSAVEKDDLDTAKRRIAAYYRERTGTYHYVDAQDPAGHITDRDRRLRSARPLVNRTGAYDEEYWEGDFFDWERAEIRRKWRMYFFQGFGEAAAVGEGDEIAGALVNLMRSFVHRYHSPAERGSGAWATMNAGIRMRTGWPVAFLCLLQSPAFTDEDIILFLKSVWDQTDYIRRHHSETSNWLTFEMAGLYTSGAVYPEFGDAEEWRRFAGETAVEDMEHGWLPDGMTIELSPGYGQFFSNFFVIYDLAGHVGRLGEFNLAELPGKTEGPYESYLRIMAPDRYAPATNNNRPVSVVGILEAGLERLPEREDFRWVVTGGEEGSPPAFTSTVLPYAGFAAMRSGWERDANMLYFDFGPVGYRHAHQDGLNLMLWAYGRQVLFDPGLSAYDYEDPFVNYAVDTFSHNTVLVDNRPQRRPWYDNPHPNRMPYEKLEDFRWETGERHDSAYGVYEEAYGMPGVSDAYPYSEGSNFREGWVYPAHHHRRVFFLKPDIFVVDDTLVSKDGEAHEYEVRWHLDSADTGTVHNGMGVVTEDEGRPNLEVVPLFTEDLEVRAAGAQTEPEILGWNAGNPHDPQPATTVRHIKSGSGTTRFLTLLLPLEAGQDSLLQTVEPLDASTLKVELKDGRRFAVHAPPDPDHDLAASFLGDSGAAFYDDFESYPPGMQPSRPDDASPYFWRFGFGGDSENRKVEVVPTWDADGEATQAMRLYQNTPLADSRDGLSFLRKFEAIADEELEMSFRFRLNENLYDPDVQSLAGTYYQIRLRDAAGNVAVRLQVTLDGEDGLRDRVTPDNPMPGFTLQQGPDRDTDRVNLIPEILVEDWYEIVIRTYPPDRTFDIDITNRNSDDPDQSTSATGLGYAENAAGISEFSGARAWTWSILDAHMDDVRIRTAAELAEPSGFEAWRQEHFTANELENPAISGPSAMPAGDGTANLLKYALGLAPKVSAGPGDLPIQEIRQVDDERYLTLTFSRPEEAGDITYRVEASGDLEAWTDEAVRVGELTQENDDGTISHTYRDVRPIGDGNRRFLRLRVEEMQ